MKANEAPKIIIQLILSALLFYFYSFRFKSSLLAFLSEQVYYQVLIILVILSGYIAKWLDNLRVLIIHHTLLKCSSSYKMKHLKQGVEILTEKTVNAQLSQSAQAMMTEITSSDFELENMVKEMHDQIQRIKK
ncbi:hypothetical protein [Enterobacter sichuanensis]|uniref:hypothetical protein n=2 Tax=Enterobacter sichuanensis TaxID=2071710 RepID=UPI0028141E32|nr:hypothetical protein [Enterobacter sichuanensis]MDR0175414.1 hypothetical protein [Enterobacter sichuanensis]HCJ8216140.1 hypothetical protein [Escherichia coli]